MRRGFSLAYVLTLAALAFLLVGLAINSSLQLYRREQQQRHREQAILYSKNGLERAVARLAENPEWGKQPTDGLVVPALAGHPADACARVTFDPSSPDASVNQLDRDGTAEVPKNTVHLWSVGSYGGVKVRTEAFVAKPQFPFAIASSGPLRTSGSFFTGTVDDPAKADLALESPEFQQSLKQASLLSNGDSVSLLGSPVHITGDVVCHGSVERGAGVLVDGEVRSHASAKQIPHFDMASFDTAGKPLLDEIPPGDLSRSSA
ncbi:hypothetical protein JST97_37865, partial [bacterium]|nr:hypothetical protein [bacterium]